MTPAELLAKLQSLACDEELPLTARHALQIACVAGLEPTDLETVLREAFDCLAGMVTANHVARVVSDLVTTGLPNHASLAV